MNTLRIFLLINFVIIVAGCDIFNVREAEIPIQPRTNYQFPSTPDILVENLKNSYSDKNIQDYMSCLADSVFSGVIFKFLPSAGSATIYPGLQSDWTRQNEEQYFSNLLNKLSDNEYINLSFTGVNLSMFGDSALYTASYTVILPENMASLPQRYQGEVKFTMVVDTRLAWSIKTWADVKNSEFPTWSDLKGMNY